MLYQDANLKLLINGAAWESPTVPVLLQILSGASSAQDLMPSASIIELPRDTVIQLSMPAGVAGGPVCFMSPRPKTSPDGFSF